MKGTGNQTLLLAGSGRSARHHSEACLSPTHSPLVLQQDISLSSTRTDEIHLCVKTGGESCAASNPLTLDGTKSEDLGGTSRRWAETIQIRDFPLIIIVITLFKSRGTPGTISLAYHGRTGLSSPRQNEINVFYTGLYRMKPCVQKNNDDFPTCRKNEKARVKTVPFK